MSTQGTRWTRPLGQKAKPEGNLAVANLASQRARAQAQVRQTRSLPSIVRQGPAASDGKFGLYGCGCTHTAVYRSRLIAEQAARAHRCSALQGPWVGLISWRST